jgi:hypothetical protein
MRRDPIVQLVTFATENMSRAQDLCYLSALTKAKIDRGCRFSWWDVERLPYYTEYKALFNAPRGPSYWAWKSALINKIMGPDSFVYDVLDGDILIYADAGIEFIAPIQPIIDRMNQDIFLFGNNYEHAHWCKRDVISYVWPMSVEEWRQRWWSKTDKQRQEENPDLVHWERYHRQAQASVIFFRVSDYSRQFVAEWLKWCLFEGGRLIDDSPSRLPNHPEFREHRHDQAILTTLAYREGIKLHAWPAVYNRFLGQEFVYSREGYPETDNYGSLFHHHRLRNSEFETLGIKV